jgi:4-amino-4-deoxy-L-arabinose transferase-like glycosyltransferase
VKGIRLSLASSAVAPHASARLSALVERWLGLLTQSHLRAALALAVVAILAFAPGQFALQPMDRDEPRFAQASKQMIETGDFVDIRFQDEARHKKPVGIYWLQAAAVGAAKALGAPDAMRTIGYYRIPSFLAAIASVLLFYWAALAFLSRRGAFVAAALLGTTVLLGVEARLAKTDATLLLTCMVCFGVLARLWLHARSPATARPPRQLEIWLFWIAMGAGVLVKGPITPMVAFVPALALSLHARSARWLLPLRPLAGLAIVLLIAAPWLVAIAIKSGGSFFADSLGEDMLAKVGQGKERHWGPPGLYAVLFWATAWPAAVIMAFAFRFAWVERRDDGVTFLIAWALPCWLIFEAVQTKLPHYVLPLYPAIVVLAVLAVERDAAPFHWRSARWIAAPLALLVPLLLLGAATAGFWFVDRSIAFLALPFLLAALGLAFFAMRALQRAEPMAGSALLVASSLLLSAGAYPFGLPQLQAINLSKRLAAAAHAVPCARPAYASAGYNEPSLVFLTDTEIDLTDGASAGVAFAAAGCRIAFVEGRQEARFLAALEAVGDKPALRTRVAGININSGRRLDIGVYVRER